MAAWTELLDRFFEYLADHGITSTEMTQKQSFAIQKQWTSKFGGFRQGTRHKHGYRAVEQFLSEPSRDYVILFLSSRITAFPISTNQRPCAAFEFAGSPVDLSAFNELEFAVFPNSYDWTMVHTHEDGSLGGPYFVYANDITNT